MRKRWFAKEEHEFYFRKSEQEELLKYPGRYIQDVVVYKI